MRAYGAHAWGRMVACVYGVGLFHDTNSYAWGAIGHDDMGPNDPKYDILCHLLFGIHNANFSIDVIFLPSKVANVLYCQTTSLTFASKI